MGEPLSREDLGFDLCHFLYLAEVVSLVSEEGDSSQSVTPEISGAKARKVRPLESQVFRVYQSEYSHEIIPH